MKPKAQFLVLALVAWVTGLQAQNVAVRTNEFEVDLSDPKKLVTATIPVITWVTPAAETTYTQENRFKIKFEIESNSPIKNITITVKDGTSANRGPAATIEPPADDKLSP